MIKRLIISILIILLMPLSICYSQEEASNTNTENDTNIEKPANTENINQNELKTLSMRECINIALLNNPEIKAAISDTDIIKTRISQAKAAYVPEINFSGGYNYNNSASYITFIDNSVNAFDIATVGLTQLIYDFGKTFTNIKIQQTNFKSSKEDLQYTINNTVYAVKKAYYDLLLAYERKHVYEESVKMYTEQLNQAKALYEVGEKPKVDMLTAKVNLSNANLELIKATNGVVIAYAALNNAMGIPEMKDYKVAENLEYLEKDYNFDDLINLAIENRPDYKSALLKSESAKLQIKLAKTEFAPKIEAFSNYNVAGFNVNHDSTTDTGWSVGARLNLTALNIYRNKKKVDEAKASYNKEIHNSEILKNKVYLEIQQAYSTFVESKKSIPVSKVALEEAKENFDMTNGRYRVGFGDHVELNDADFYYVNAKLAYYKALYDYNMSLVALEKFIGQEFTEETEPKIEPEIEPETEIKPETETKPESNTENNQ
ncbi:MAG: TolC family protein [Vampirovibrionia bacterium]